VTFLLTVFFKYEGQNHNRQKNFHCTTQGMLNFWYLAEYLAHLLKIRI